MIIAKDYSNIIAIKEFYPFLSFAQLVILLDFLQSYLAKAKPMADNYVRLLSCLLIVVASLWQYHNFQEKKNQIEFKDFSGVHQAVPSEVILLQDGDSLQKILRSSKGLNIAVRGTAHSLSGLAITDGMLIINQNKKTLRMRSDTLVEASSGFSVGRTQIFIFWKA